MRWHSLHRRELALTTQSRKHRGYRTQKVFAEFIQWLFPYAEPTGAGRQGKDILSTPGVHFELKARSGFEPKAAMKQARAEINESDIPIIILRMNGQGEANIGEWVALTDVDTMLKLLNQAGYGRDWKREDNG